MTEVPITVGIPVGPRESNRRWLDECLDSVRAQTVTPSEILVVDDGGQLELGDDITVFRTPWPSGVTIGFNYCVMGAKNDLVIMLGSDDSLYPRCVETCWDFWNTIKDPHGYYILPLASHDFENPGKVWFDPCNAAMVHKELWRLTGGFPVESSLGACDSWLTLLIQQNKGHSGTLRVVGEEPLYGYRGHLEDDSTIRTEWRPIMYSARDFWLKKNLING